MYSIEFFKYPGVLSLIYPIIEESISGCILSINSKINLSYEVMIRLLCLPHLVTSKDAYQSVADSSIILSG